MIRGVIFFVIILFTFSAYAQVEKITGYAGYKFGMGYNQAQNVNAKDKHVKCKYQNAHSCLRSNIKLFDKQAKLDAMFDKKTSKVTKIFVQINLEEKTAACLESSNKILTSLQKKHGEPTIVENEKISWFATKGGSVVFRSYCVPGSFAVYIDYLDSLPL